MDTTESLIERSLTRAARRCHIQLLGDMQEAAKWKQFALRKKHHLQRLHNDMPMSKLIAPDENTTIHIQIGPVTDVIRIEVNGGVAHGIAVTPCTSESPQGFGVPMIDDNDTWGRSGVIVPEYYTPPVDRESGGKAYQLAFLTHGKDGKPIKPANFPSVKHGKPWAPIAGPRKTLSNGETTDLRYGGSDGVKLTFGAANEQVLVYSLKNKRTVWGIYPTPTPSTLYVDGQPAKASIQVGDTFYTINNAMALGARDKTLILLCYVQSGYAIYTATATGKRNKSLIFTQVGDPITFPGMAVNHPNFIFNQSGTWASAVIPFTVGSEIDTKVVHIQLDGGFAPTMEIVAPPATFPAGAAYANGYYDITYDVTANRSYFVYPDNNDVVPFDPDNPGSWQIEDVWTDGPYVTVNWVPVNAAVIFQSTGTTEQGFPGEAGYLVGDTFYNYDYTKTYLRYARRPVACGYDGNDFLLVEVEETYRQVRHVEAYDNKQFFIRYGEGRINGTPYTYWVQGQNEQHGFDERRTYYFARRFLINGEEKSTAAYPSTEVNSWWHYTITYPVELPPWPPDPLPEVWTLDDPPVETFDAGQDYDNWEVTRKINSTHAISLVGSDLHNRDIYTVHRLYAWVTGSDVEPWVADFDASVFKNNTRIHTIYSGTYTDAGGVQ